MHSAGFSCFPGQACFVQVGVQPVLVLLFCSAVCVGVSSGAAPCLSDHLHSLLNSSHVRIPIQASVSPKPFPDCVLFSPNSQATFLACQALIITSDVIITGDHFSKYISILSCIFRCYIFQTVYSLESLGPSVPGRGFKPVYQNHRMGY